NFADGHALDFAASSHHQDLVVFVDAGDAHDRAVAISFDVTNAEAAATFGRIAGGGGFGLFAFGGFAIAFVGLLRPAVRFKLFFWRLLATGTRFLFFGGTIWPERGPLAKAQFAGRQQRGLGIGDDHANNAVVPTKADAADAGRIAAHRADVGLSETN